MKNIAEKEKENIVVYTFQQQISSASSCIEIYKLEVGIGVLIMGMDEINELIRRTNNQDTDTWFSLSEVERRDCAASLMRNVFDGVKDQIEYAIADNFGIQMTLSTPTMS